MILDHLPAVLQHPRGSISMERALKQIKSLLERVDTTDGADEAALQASLDDVDSMLEKIQ